MALKEFLTDLVRKNAATESAEMRKLHDGEGLYLWVCDENNFGRLN